MEIKTRKLWICIGIITVLILAGCDQALPEINGKYSSKIRINQVGYYPQATKKAVVVDTAGYGYFEIVDLGKSKVVYTGILSESQQWNLAGEQVRIADFSEVTEVGSYAVLIDGLGYSYPFEIRDAIFKDALIGSVKGLYYQRAGMALEQRYAGQWERPAGHIDDSVQYHPSSGKTEGFRISQKGWYDAGDFGKYVVNGSFPLGQFFQLYEHYPNTFGDSDLNIPESGNGQNDFIDELRYELDWLLSMQDEDGGVFFKLTTKNFEGLIMPHEASSPRYIIGKSTGATLDFSAVAAQAYRIFREKDSVYALNLEAAKQAYAWAVAHPNDAYTNPSDVRTGEYGNSDFSQEWIWANSELYLATHENNYLAAVEKSNWDLNFVTGDGWASFMRFLGAFSLVNHKEEIPDRLFQMLRHQLLKVADDLAANTQTFDYFQPINTFKWGSNSDVLNAGMIMAQAYRLDPKPIYLESIQQGVNYIFGTNAVGYSFLTGFGDNPPMHIHHRQSAGDTIKAPVPGLLSGGPNSGMQDKSDGVPYPENAPPMKSWADHVDSYASNEICLNWNAPFTYVLGFLEAEANR